MIKAAVVGASGYAGAELVRILSGHCEVELTAITSRQYAGTAFSEIYPAMTQRVSLVCETYDAQSICDRADVVFTALPHKLPMDIVPDFIKKDKKVVDLSADFRFQDASTYEAHYQPHSSKDLLTQSVYGLCEVYFERIKNTSLIGNPGCYPTSVLLPLVPLLKNEIIDRDTIIADSKSGVSGAGRGLSLTSHFCEVNESFKAYKVAEHRHCPEMEEVLSIESGNQVNLTFVPHLLPVTRGILTTQYAKLKKDFREEDIRNCFHSFYSKREFVRICPEGRLPDTANVRGTNYCDIGFRVDKRNNQLILISAIDNLVKGAAGQAVQNMNIMFGLDEATGLDGVPFPI